MAVQCCQFPDCYILFASIVVLSVDVVAVFVLVLTLAVIVVVYSLFSIVTIQLFANMLLCC